MRKKLLIFVLVIALISGIAALQASLTQIRGTEWKQESVTYLPQNERIKPFLMGFETTVANYLWIRSVLYFGDHYITDRNFEFFVKMVDVVTRLNPYFYPAYEFAGLMIPDICNNPDAARVILERGIFYIGETQWKVAFYLGMVYYKYYDDSALAAYYLALASQSKGAPAVKLAQLAAAFYNKTENLASSNTFLYFLYQTSESPDVRKFLMEKIADKHAEINVEK